SVPASNTTGSYTVSWTAVATSTQYELQEQINGGSWIQIHAAGGTSKSISGTASGVYAYRVRACNVGGCGSYGGVKSTSVTRPPSAVPTVSAPASSSNGN